MSVRAVAAYNTSKRDREGRVFHPREAGGVGYDLNVRGERLYHAGDTDVIPEMDSVAGVDVALLPVSGTYVMTAGEAAEAARRIQPRVAVPMHWGEHLGTREDALAFERAGAGGGHDHGEGRWIGPSIALETMAARGAGAGRAAVRADAAGAGAAARRAACLRPGGGRARHVAGGRGWERRRDEGRTVDNGNGSGGDGSVDFELSTDASRHRSARRRRSRPLGLMVGGKLQLSGKRRRALQLRALADGADPTIADALAAGAELDADAIYRSLALPDRPGVDARPQLHGRATRSTATGRVARARRRRRAGERVAGDGRAAPNATVATGLDTYRGLVSGAMTPPEAMQQPPDRRRGRAVTRPRCSAAGSTAPRAATTPSSSARRASGPCRSAGAGRGAATRATALPLPAARPVGDSGDPAHDSAGDAPPAAAT